MEFMSALGSQEDAYRPSLFELVAQEKLRDLLQPAVQYVTAVYAQRYPRLLIRLVNNHEEFYAILMFLIERHYLKEWGASFAENFYGLKRLSTGYLESKRSQLTLPVNNGQSPALTRKEINKSLLVLVGLPYIKCRMDLFYQQISGDVLGINEQEEKENDELADPTTPTRRKFKIRLIKLFRTIYPYINAIYYGSGLIYNILYMFNKTNYHSPWLHLIGLQIKRMSMADYRAYYDKVDASQLNSSTSSLLKNPLRLFSGIFSKFIEFLKVLLPMSIFFFKFLEWWYSSEFARGTGKYGEEDTENNITPPEKTKPDPRGIKLPSTPNTCPLCSSNPINNPTALPSGYVFCYTCAYRYVEDHNRCPVSWIKIDRGVEDLTKVYADGNL
ncbi:Pex12 amino terminal region-domain-containing protein [Halteromyces radiatus]|uniref:Pex12 amino terminal region-domain-containing protein n=1 Tax=Halteromyces radiatus TaxID=101107 RepID=UPI002220A847|nr:Pex12 amino terminal region-domain-containing protein [Halteromyces radiatus]KAI8083161.1 Pex12 amino terminal region-domain-containing protein [Halteromyces radiatus]